MQRFAPVLVALAVGCGGPAAAPVSSVAAAAGPADVREGQAIYDRYCALCHGAGAKGYAADEANQLRNPSFLQTATDDFLRIAIERGRPGTPMAAFGEAHGGPLDRTQTDRIIAWLRSLQKQPLLDVHDLRVAGDAERGAALYAQHCASCHGDRGQGKSALSLNNPTFLASASQGFVRHAIENGRPGTQMRAFGSVLSPDEIDDVTAFIGSFISEVDPSAPAVAQTLPALSDLVINPDGPTPTFTLREERFVPADEVAKALGAGSRMVVLDARPLSDWHRGHIPGAFPTPFYDTVDAIAEALPKDGTWIVAYCACPHAASGKVVDALRARGFERAVVLDEGIIEWERRGHPMRVTAAKPAKK